MQPKNQRTFLSTKSIQRFEKKRNFHFENSKLHPILVPFFSALAGLTIFFALILFEVTLMFHWV